MIFLFSTIQVSLYMRGKVGRKVFRVFPFYCDGLTCVLQRRSIHICFAAVFIS